MYDLHTIFGYLGLSLDYEFLQFLLYNTQIDLTLHETSLPSLPFCFIYSVLKKLKLKM